MKVKSAFIILFLAFVLKSSAQIKWTKLTSGEIPKSIKYIGKVVNAIRYADKGGNYLVITTETGIKAAKKDEDFRGADLYAYHYIESNNDPKLIWQMHDFVKDCGVDVLASFVPGSFAVTDLNKDGQMEVWLMYKTACRGDVSPSTMKIIMHQGEQKYAIRGTTKVVVSGMKPEGGDFILDDAFKSGPEVFRKYAADLWKKNLIETWK